MKILEIIPQLSSGGGERFIVDLCNEISKQHEVVLIVLYSLDQNAFYLSQLSKRVRCVSLDKKPGFDFSMFMKLHRLVCKEKPDAVHTHLRSLLYVSPTAYCNKKIRFFHTIHNDAQKEASDILSRFVRKCLFKDKKITPVTISPESKESYLKYYKEKEVVCINNGRDIPTQINVTDTVREEFLQYRKTPATKVIICLARIDRVKRQLLLARVANRLFQEKYDFSLLFIGSTKQQKLVDLVRREMPPCAFILGEKQNPIEYLDLADGFCLFSEYEGLPIALIEALGCGCVPVCTPVGGIKNLIVDGVNGFLSENLGQESCYNALRAFLELPQAEHYAMSVQAKTSYEPFTMSCCAEKYIALFRR